MKDWLKIDERLVGKDWLKIDERLVLCSKLLPKFA